MKRRAMLLRGAAGVLFGAMLAPARATARELSIGVTPGPQAELAELVGQVAASRGLALRIEVREGGRGINADVERGRLDVASFQNAIGLAAEMRARHGSLVEVAATITQPIAVYSRRRRSVRLLEGGDTIGLPSDRAGLARALILLQNFGLVGLRDGAGFEAQLGDVVRNPRDLRLLALPPVKLAPALDRLSCAVIDRPHAVAAGLLPARDSIGIEDARTPYADALAVRRADRDAPWLVALVESYRSDSVKHFILEHFQDSVRRPW